MAYLNNKCCASLSRVEIRLRETGVSSRVKLGCFGDGQRLIGRLNESGLSLEIDELAVFEPFDLELEIRVVDGVATEGGRVRGLDLVVLGSSGNPILKKHFCFIHTFTADTA